MEDIKLNFELSVAEVNIVLRSLGKHPFEEIAALVQKIREQGEAQLAEIQATAAAAEQAKAE